MIKLLLLLIKTVKFLKNKTILLGSRISKVRIFNNRVFWFLLPYLLVLIFLIILPLFFVLLYSLINPTHNNLNFALNFKNFVVFFSDSSFITSLLLALGYAVAAAVIGLLIGYPIALIMANTKNKWIKQNMLIFITLPIWINLIIRMIGLQSLFKIINPNLIGSPISIIIGMVYAFLPFMILPIYNSLHNFNQAILHASSDLGASPWNRFLKITFRYSLPGVVAGIALLMVQAMTSLLVVHFMGQGRSNLIVQVIQSYLMQNGSFGVGAAISVILAVFIFLLLTLSHFARKLFQNKKTKSNLLGTVVV